MVKCAGPTPLQMGWAVRELGFGRSVPGDKFLQSRTQASNPTMLRLSESAPNLQNEANLGACRASP